ncbi:MAG: RDD family protein [Acidimicrobiia bacterium]|nr:RDD family protein [Acidimicrobiia bacterium]MDH5294193.1 RDD family protein [Acidimicrobiia bacterium]
MNAEPISAATTAAPARALPRLRASALDLAVVAGWAVFAAAAGVVARAFDYDFASPTSADIFAFVTLVGPVVLTFAFQEASSRKATFGKRRLGLQVTDRSGRRLSLARSLTRSIVKFLPWQLAHTAVIGLFDDSTNSMLIVAAIGAQALVLASVIAMAVDPYHRSFHDWLAGTRVVAEEHSRRSTTEGGST